MPISELIDIVDATMSKRFLITRDWINLRV